MRTRLGLFNLIVWAVTAVFVVGILAIGSSLTHGARVTADDALAARVAVTRLDTLLLTADVEERDNVVQTTRISSRTTDLRDQVEALFARTGRRALVGDSLVSLDTAVKALVTEAKTPETRRPQVDAARAALVEVDRLTGLRYLDAVRSAQARSVATWVSALVLLAASLALTVWRWLSERRRLDAQIRAVSAALRRFADGDPAARVDVDLGAGLETHMLTAEFNRFAADLDSQLRQLQLGVEQAERVRAVSDALEAAVDQDDVARIVRHAFAILTPETSVEVLIRDEETTDLSRLVSNPTAPPPNCPVDTTDNCVAIRRGMTMTFDGPDAVVTCPQLSGRSCSAVCVPIVANGLGIGVVHATGPENAPPESAVVEQLVSLSSSGGLRIGLLRALARSERHATLDPLTGIANRRSFSGFVDDLFRRSTPFVLILTDIDRFKNLNDRYGHEVGDRALQVFAGVLAANVRERDLVARYGGEEFALVCPRMDVGRSMEVLQRIRAALADELALQGLPSFTASFGVTHSATAMTVDAVVRIADAGLLMAKELGRNRVVYADADLAAEVFAPERQQGDVPERFRGADGSPLSAGGDIPPPLPNQSSGHDT
jgi:diguanylate cyclase (GGDEF)-like protein